MAKNKAKPRRSNRVVASRNEIDQAKYAKSKGLLSKRAKLGNGKLSRAVKKKVARLADYEVIPVFELRPGAKRSTIAKAPTRKAVKLKPSAAREYREKGFATFGNYSIQPKDQSRFKDLINNGFAFATTYYGYDVIDLKVEGVENYADLDRVLKSGKLDKYIEDDTNFFSFTFYGEHPLGNRTFISGEELAQYLEHYKWSQEAIDKFQIIVLPPDGYIGNTPAHVRAETKKFFNPKTVQDRRSAVRKFKVMTKEEAARKHALDDKAYRAKKREKFGDKGWRAMEAARKAQSRKSK